MYKCVHGDKFARVGLLQPRKLVVLGQQVVTYRHHPQPARTDRDAPEQVVDDSLSAVGRVLQRMSLDRSLDRIRHSVRVQRLGARQPVERPIGGVRCGTVGWRGGRMGRCQSIVEMRGRPEGSRSSGGRSFAYFELFAFLDARRPGSRGGGEEDE